MKKVAKKTGREYFWQLRERTQFGGEKTALGLDYILNGILLYAFA